MCRGSESTWTWVWIRYFHHSVKRVCELFDKMHQWDIVSWMAMIARFAWNGFVNEALELFHDIPQKDVVSWNWWAIGFSLEYLFLRYIFLIFNSIYNYNSKFWIQFHSSIISRRVYDDVQTHESIQREMGEAIWWRAVYMGSCLWERQSEENFPISAFK